MTVTMQALYNKLVDLERQVQDSQNAPISARRIITSGGLSDIDIRLGRVTAAGGNIVMSSDGVVLKGTSQYLRLQSAAGTDTTVLYLDSSSNTILENFVSGAHIYLILDGAGGTEFLYIYDRANSLVRFSFGNNGGMGMKSVTANPAYVDGYAILYFYSTGGVDELRVRGKIGATETQVTLANLSP